MFLESKFHKLSAFEGFIKIYTLKKLAIWNFEPSERSSSYVQSLISHIGDVNKTPTALIVFRTLPQILYVNTIYKYKCNILKYKLKFLKYNFSTRCATDYIGCHFWKQFHSLPGEKYNKQRYSRPLHSVEVNGAACWFSP